MALHRLRARDHLLGNGLGQRLEDGVVEADLGLPAGDHGEGVDAVDHRPLRGHHPDVPVEAFVHRQIRIGDALERVSRGGEGLRPGGVHGRAALRVRPGEVEQHAIVVDQHAHRQPHGLVGEPVVVHVPFRHVLALRQSGEFRLRAPVGVGDELVHVEVHRLRTVAVEQCGEARRTPVLLAANCARKSPAVSRLERIWASTSRKMSSTIFPACTIFTGGMMTPFLVDFPEGAHACGGASAHVHVVGQVAEVALDFALVVEGRDHHDVVQLRAARVGVVDHEVIARPEVLGPVLDHRLAHRSHHGPEVVGLAERLRDGTKVPVEQAAREIAAGLDVGGVGAAAQRQRHFLRGLEKAVAEDLELDGDRPSWGAPRLSRRLNE